jgi:phage replication-related protein YjqB (UPF0714/DUF867 family)
MDVIDDLEAIPTPLRGVHRNNPVNLPADGGVQLELPVAWREGEQAAQVETALVAHLADRDL